MNKADLKERWGRYCDTDKLVTTTMNLLKKCDHRNTEHGVCTMLDKYFTNKQSLIDIIASSPHYNGDMRIVLDVELERTNQRQEISRFCSYFLSNVEARNAVVKKVDEFGKSVKDYAKTGIKSFNVMDMFDDEFVKTFFNNAERRAMFDRSGQYIPSLEEYNLLENCIQYGFGGNIDSTVSDYTIRTAKDLKKPVTLASGMKTSRAFNKVCNAYGIDQLPAYNKLFAQYADMVTSQTRHIKFFISVNPLDYLTMSFGNSWTSCHNIKSHGGWCGGCVSYMLDTSSIITFVHTEMPNSIEDGKIYRNMFHYHNGALLQARVYPQENDGATNLYNKFFDVFVSEFSSLIGVDKAVWKQRKGNYLSYVKSKGVHYKDYENYSRYKFYVNEEIDGAAKAIIPIGHTRICPYCGDTTDDMRTNQLSDTNCRIS